MTDIDFNQYILFCFIGDNVTTIKGVHYYFILTNGREGYWNIIFYQRHPKKPPTVNEVLKSDSRSEIKKNRVNTARYQMYLDDKKMFIVNTKDK